MNISRNKDNVTRICGKFFMPGVNHVDNDLYERLLKDRQFNHEIRSGSMSIVGADATAEAELPPVEEVSTTMHDFPTKQFIPLIKETVDRETLEFWLEGEERASVIKAINKQLKAIEPPAAAAEVTDEIPKDESKEE